MTSHANFVQHLASCFLLELCRNCREPVSDVSCAASLCQLCWGMLTARTAQLDWCLPPDAVNSGAHFKLARPFSIKSTLTRLSHSVSGRTRGLEDLASQNRQDGQCSSILSPLQNAGKKILEVSADIRVNRILDKVQNAPPGKKILEERPKQPPDCEKRSFLQMLLSSDAACAYLEQTRAERVASKATGGSTLKPDCEQKQNDLVIALQEFLQNVLENKFVTRHATHRSAESETGHFRAPSGTPSGTDTPMQHHIEPELPLPVASAMVYEGLVRELIHSAKYRNDPLIAEDLAALLPPALYLLEPHIDLESAVLVPIPLSRLRFMSRGFNQAEILATELAKLTGLPARPAMLTRKHTTPQHNLARDERFENLRGSFKLGSRPARTVILVDDIYTSGATILEAANTLRQAGVEQIAAVTVARAVLGNETRK